MTSKKARLMSLIDSLGTISGCTVSKEKVRCHNCAWEVTDGKSFVKVSERHFSSNDHKEKAKWRLVIDPKKDYQIKFSTPQRVLPSFFAPSAESSSEIQDEDDNIQFQNPCSVVSSKGIQCQIKPFNHFDVATSTADHDITPPSSGKDNTNNDISLYQIW